VEADIRCPKCGKESQMQLRACVNVSLHPEEKSQVLDGSFFQYTCPDCGKKIPVLYPCLYDDMGKALMIYLLPDETETALEKLNSQQEKWSKDMLKAAEICTMRAVRTPNELCEKIKIFDAGLDDRYVELAKAFVFAQFIRQKPDFQAAQVLFEQHDEKNGIVLIDRSGKAMWAEFPEGLYDEIIRMFSEKVGSGKSTQYELIDANWSVKILENKEK
jgi:hypothetical protein